MPVPVYLAANCKEIATFTGRAAVLGLGFLPDGGARIPACPLQGHMAVIDDAVLPQRVPEETLDRLAARCGGGCCLDFLRTPGPVHRAVAQGLQRRLGNAPMLLPAAYHAFAPEALPVLSCLRPCNAWDGFVRSAERRFPNGWALELTPWEAELPAPALPYPGGMLPAALCSCEKSPAGLRYFDTPESLRQKLAHAAAHGCRCAIGLWQELQPFFPERDG